LPLRGASDRGDWIARVRATDGITTVDLRRGAGGVQAQRGLCGDRRSGRDLGQRSRSRFRTGRGFVNPVFLLDTNVFSEALRPEPRQRILQKITRFRDEIAI